MLQKITNGYLKRPETVCAYTARLHTGKLWPVENNSYRPLLADYYCTT